MPGTCNLVVFWDEEANLRMPALSLRDEGFESDAAAAVASGAKCILLADCRGPEDLQRCDMALSVAEAGDGRDAGATLIVASLDSAAGLMQLSSLGGKSARLAGLTWNRAAFCDSIGCTHDSPVAGHARISIIIAARAFGVPAYDSQEMDQDAGAFGFDGIAAIE
jgi:citrate lyase subunit beta/citryl-CoA lyase